MLIDVPMPELPETPEGKRIFMEGMVHATELIQALLAKHWLMGRENILLEAVRTECEGNMLAAADIVRLAQAEEKAAEIKAQRRAEKDKHEQELLRQRKIQA